MDALAGSVILADSDHAWWPIFPLLWLLFIAGIVALCVFGRRRRCWRSAGQTGESRLAERYATGEIDEQEYRQRLSVLREKP